MSDPRSATGRGEVLVLDEAEVRSLTSPAEALAAVREAFVRLAQGEASLPPILDFDFPDAGGEAHVKGAHLHGSGRWSIKVATGFYENPRRFGLPPSNGLSLVFSDATGLLEALLLDNGYLTELRTAAAGALATDLLARAQIDRALIVGAGGQARYQLESLIGVRDPALVEVWSRRPEAARELAAEAAAIHNREVVAATDLEAAIGRANVVVTCTPARTPLIRSSWVRAGTHVTAVGSDFVGKQELEAALLARAALVAVDDRAAAAANGELQHAEAAGLLAREETVTLGELIGGAPGRSSAEDVTVADLVGVGVQDAAIANSVLERALEAGVGSSTPL